MTDVAMPSDARAVATLTSAPAAPRVNVIAVSSGPRCADRTTSASPTQVTCGVADAVVEANGAVLQDVSMNDQKKVWMNSTTVGSG
jgi:hypothetical protein